MNILIAGYPYIRENYFNTFRYYPAEGKIFFLFPKIWKAKNGKIVFNPPEEPNVFTTKAYFYHSHYFLIGGLLKGWMPAFPLVLWRLKKNKNIGLVYSPSEPVLFTTLYQAFWTKFFGLKHAIFTWENISYEHKFRGLNLLLKKLIIKLNLFLSDGVICGNKKAEHIIRQLTQKPTVVIPLSGIDSDFFNPNNKIDPKRPYGLEDKVVYAFVGAISYRKGIHLIIQALENTIRTIPEARLIIAGSGEYETEVDRLIKERKLENYIIRISWVKHDELVKILSAADIFLYPSLSYGGWEEQFGYSMAEASLMELPVISTLSGSIEDIVKNGETGLLVKPDDRNDLEQAMIKLGLDRELRIKMGQAGRQYVIENFSNKIIAGKFYEFFKKINLHS
mgnify:CR=1 FL=1